MIFSSTTFIFVFLPCVLAAYYLLKETYRNAFLLIASLFFYAWGEPKFVFIMIISIVINYLTALGISYFADRGGRYSIRKLLLGLSVCLNIGLLFIFKYLNFTTSYLSKLIPSLPVTSIALPIGISFFTFQGLSYIIDIYNKQERVQRNVIDLGLYISFFPQLIAGPIVRYKTIAAEIKGRKSEWSDFCQGVKRFIIGISKKIILANNMALVSDKAFSLNVGELTVVMGWLGMICYTFQIYFDFSGYSDMAIGLGRMFGFHFNENFDSPYTSKSITEFWRRWHISLGSWFRDYVYIPLGGSRVKRERHIFNLFVVWLLTGIWHGARWNFIVWGFLHFVLLIIEKYLIHPENLTRLKGILWQVFSVFCIAFGWVIFRANGLHGAFRYIKGMFGLNGNEFIKAQTVFYGREYIFLILITALFSVPLSDWIKNRLSKLQENGKASFLIKIAASSGIEIMLYCTLFLFSVSYLVMGAHNPFIYFNF